MHFQCKQVKVHIFGCDWQIREFDLLIRFIVWPDFMIYSGGMHGQAVNTWNSGSGCLGFSLACHIVSLDKGLYSTLSLLTQGPVVRRPIST